jgi:hypothetical protein
MGEAAAASLFILGLLIFSFLRKNEKYLRLSMFIFGLSVFTKLIFLIAIFPVLIYYLIELEKKNNIEKKIRLFIISFAAFILPYLLWEFYKLFILGLSDYIHSIFDMVATYKRIYDKNNQFSWIEFYAKRNASLIEKSRLNLSHFLLSIPIIFLILRRSDLKKEHKEFASILIISVLLGLFWWVFLSKGRHRYALPFIFSFFTLLPFLIVVVNNMSLRIILFVLLGFNLSTNISDFDPIKNIYYSRFSCSEKTKNLDEIVGILKKQEKENIFVSGHWCTYSEIEYALPGANNFAHYDHLDKNIDYNKILLVRNTVYVERYPDENFNEFAKSFTDTVFHKSPYLVTKYSGPKE